MRRPWIDVLRTIMTTAIPSQSTRKAIAILYCVDCPEECDHSVNFRLPIAHKKARHLTHIVEYDE